MVAADDGCDWNKLHSKVRRSVREGKRKRNGDGNSGIGVRGGRNKTFMAR